MILSLATLFCFFLAVQASPLLLAPRAKLDVFVPKIVSPCSDTVWVTGQTATVVWDISNLPPHISNRAIIYLDHISNASVLIQDFDLSAGSVEIVVPSVESLWHNIILFGDSGNRSPRFKIENNKDDGADLNG